MSGGPVLAITEDSTRADLAEALAHLSRKAGRVTVADAKHAAIHHDIDDLLDAWMRADG